MTMEEWEENRCPYCTADYCISKNCSVNRISIPDGATNGDVIKTLFSDEGTPELTLGNIVCYGDANYDKDWWNAPYERK